MRCVFYYRSDPDGRPSIDAMTHSLNWMGALSSADRRRARDLADAAATERLDAGMRAWQETGSAVSEGPGRVEQACLGNPLAVERP